MEVVGGGRLRGAESADATTDQRTVFRESQKANKGATRVLRLNDHREPKIGLNGGRLDERWTKEHHEREPVRSFSCAEHDIGDSAQEEFLLRPRATTRENS